MFDAEPLGERHMRLLGERQVAEELARIGVRGAGGGLDIKALRLTLHHFGDVADFLNAERTHQPVGLSFKITAHMLAADQRDRVAKALLVQRNQHVPVAAFLFRHVLKHFGRLRKMLPQPFRIGEIDAPVVFFRRNRQRQDFLFSQIVKGAAGGTEETGKHKVILVWNHSKLGSGAFRVKPQLRRWEKLSIS